MTNSEAFEFGDIVGFEHEFRPREDGKFDLRVAVTETHRPHRFKMETDQVDMPDGTLRQCETYGIFASEDEIRDRKNPRGLDNESAFIIRNVPMDDEWFECALRFLAKCCLVDLRKATERRLAERINTALENLDVMNAFMRNGRRPYTLTATDRAGLSLLTVLEKLDVGISELHIANDLIVATVWIRPKDHAAFQLPFGDYLVELVEA